MLLRILILIFVCNATISSAFAVQDMKDCGMMGSNSMLMATSAVDDMECEMPEEMSCNMAQCVSSCSVSISPILLPSENFSFFAAGKYQFQKGLILFYSLVHPVNTPPPLV